MGRKTVPPSGTKRALIQAGSPIYDSVVADLKFDPTAEWVEPARKPITPKAVARRVTKKTATNPKVSA